MARNAHGGFSEKNPDHSKMPKMYQKSRFFGPGSKSALRILIIFSVKVVLSSVLQPAKTVCSKKFSSLDFLGGIRFGDPMR